MTKPRVPSRRAKTEHPAAPSAEQLEASRAVMAEFAEMLSKATGTTDRYLALHLYNAATNALWAPGGRPREDAVLAIVAALEAIAPSDGLEGMLATQMVGTHEAAMECLRRAMLVNQTPKGSDLNLKHAAKLLQIYARQVEALDKHRGKGQQKITVEHVTVQSGGQAIVGNLQAPTPQRAEAPAHPRAISDQTDDVGVLPDFLAEPEPAKETVRRRRK
jgi:hypothetical protein